MSDNDTLDLAWPVPTDVAEPPATPPWMAPPPLVPEPPRRPRRGLGAVALAVALATGGFAVARLTTPTAGTTTRVETSTVTAPTTEEPVAAVAAAVAPAVVQIETGSGLGSGVLYDAKGYILTAAHVVRDAGSTVTVRLADGTSRTGRVVGTNDNADIGVVSIDPTGLTLHVAKLATGIELQVGQTAVAIGSPFGLDQTVTAGIVSAVGRPFQTTGGAIEMVQTDAPINPGNSGGALADRNGRIIGINDAIATQTGQNAGVGFAVPIDTAKAVADKLVAGQPVVFGYLGVQTQGQSQGLVGNGAIVVVVTAGSPAATAGLQAGDRITAVDAEPVAGPSDLAARVRAHQPGDRVTLTVTRKGSSRSVAVRLGSTGTSG